MRHFLFAAVFIGLLSSAVASARAGQDDPRLDRLFVQLEQARTQPEIATLMVQISGIWLESGSSIADLLLARAEEAQAKGAPDIALDLLDRIIDIAPRFAEAWRRRGALHAADGNMEDAVGDLRETLRLEPRHFGALDQLGRILEAGGDAPGALEAFTRLSEIVPFADGLRQRLERLKGEDKPAAPPI
jgi:tetratricopeptide (TPR) repeat protein